jgi:Family of unknown function (DUF6266)
MGTFSKGILGGFSGKVGNVVGARWRGKDILRSLPNKKAYLPTLAQLEQRDRFKTVMLFLTPIKPILSAFFGKQQGDKSPFNLATGYHMKYALLPDGLDGYVIDFPKVLISKGDLRGIANGGVAPAGMSIEITWNDNSGQGNASATDELVVVAYCSALNLFETAYPAATRDLQTINMPIPAYLAGQQLQVWATFVTADNKLAATSTFLGDVTMV